MITRVVLAAFLTTAFLASLFIFPLARTPFLGTNLFIVALILAMLFGGTSITTSGAIIGGFATDLLSPYPFGTYLLSYVITLATIRWIFRTRITNRSFPAYLSLVVVGIVLFYLSLYAVSAVGTFLDPHSLAPLVTADSMRSVFLDVALSLILATVIFAVVRALGRNYATLSEHEF